MERGATLLRLSRSNMNLDASRLPPGEAENVKKFVSFVQTRIEKLARLDRIIYTMIWTNLARTTIPVTPRVLSKYREETVNFAFQRLVENSLIWFDDEMQAVLQCPPFSALHTHHEVKAFGWERAYVCSIIDAPLSLLVYGPNAWLKIESTCPRSGEILTYRVKLDSNQHLELDAAAESANWRIWIPRTENGNLPVEPMGIRSRIHGFNTQTDFETYRQYHPETNAGTLYNIEQTLYLSECLLHGFQQALETDT